MRGIWRHAHLFEELPTHLPELGEGDTAVLELPKLAACLGLDFLGLKREDQNPNGSHKDRGLLYQIALHRRPQPRTHVISSSGNAATSAAAACAAVGDRLVAFVAHDTEPAKLGRIASRGGVVIKATKPVNFARYASRVFGLVNLRGTADPLASVGYRSLAGELAEIGADHLLTFSSSGVSARGLLGGFERLGGGPALWSVQSGRCIALARALDPRAVEDPDSPAGRLGARSPPGAEELAGRLRARGGGALAVDSAAVARGRARLEAAGVTTSAEGAAQLAALEELAKRGDVRGRVVVVLTGAAHADQAPGDAAEVTSYLDVRAFFTDTLALEPT